MVGLKAKIVRIGFTVAVFVGLWKGVGHLWNRAGIPVTGTWNVISLFLSVFLIPLAVALAEGIADVLRRGSEASRRVFDNKRSGDIE
ncbi:hypothetical protein [Calditerricola satsumensis]|uniref:hypothetical protein n=1 Tax=Calditerricola satsumensis TaxID=373054 RepID=UPI001E56ECEC|nr:hypothetical protein [Calditerricola satsumensis]